MPKTLSLALAQINPTVGDIAGNVRRILDARAQAGGADLIILPELCLSGYPPEDLVLKDSFLRQIAEAAHELAAATRDGGPALLIGAPWKESGHRHNAALLLDEGRIASVILKHHLPNYGVFDEARVFVPGPLPAVTPFRGHRLGIMVCEDMWYADVARHLTQQGAQILIVPNGSPYESDKQGIRAAQATARVVETGLAVVYVNQIGGQDELVFDGSSFILNEDGQRVCQLPGWQESVLLTVWHAQGGKLAPVPAAIAPPLEPLADIYQAMVCGLRDYVRKNRFPGLLLGLSGGIDSAISAAVAVDALGADKVHCVMMPSPYTSQDSLEDAAEVAKLLGVRLDEINIGPAMSAFGQMLAPLFDGSKAGIAEENIQARSRGLALMALSNKFGSMVLTTGNKSEMSVGYATLYGDMCGGYSVLKDVYKTTVFALSRWRNTHKPAAALGPAGPVMPERVITKPPTAELRPNQKDQDSLPPYDELDAILERMIEREMGPGEIVAQGFDAATVKQVFRLLDRAEYKRRQAPPGVKITSRAYGKDRRYPIVNGYTDSAR
jgi:NAD+ synthase